MSALVIAAGRAHLLGELELPRGAAALVVLANANSYAQRLIARELRRAGYGTLVVELLTPAEEHATLDRDLALLTTRLCQVVTFIAEELAARALPIALFASGAAAAASLRTARLLPNTVRAVVCAGGRPDHAGDDALAAVSAPVLLVAGARDYAGAQANELALDMLAGEREMVLVPHAGAHLSEPGAPEEAARLAADWLGRYLTIVGPTLSPQPWSGPSGLRVISS